MAEEQVLIRVDTVGAEAAAQQVAAVGVAAEQSAQRVAAAMQKMQSYTSGGITVMVPQTDELDPIPKKLQDIAGAGEKAAISGKLVHQQFNSMLPMVGLLNPRLGMLANVLENVRYVSGRAGGSLANLGTAMLGGLKALLRPELLIAAVAIAGIAYAYEKVTDSAKEAKKKIDEATEAMKKQREEREKQKEQGEQTAAKVGLGLINKGADPGQLKGIMDTINLVTGLGVPSSDAAELTVGLTRKGKKAPDVEAVIADYITKGYAEEKGITDSTPETRKMMAAALPEVKDRIAAFGKLFGKGTVPGEFSRREGEKGTSEAAAAISGPYDKSVQTTEWLTEELRKIDPGDIAAESMRAAMARPGSPEQLQFLQNVQDMEKKTRRPELKERLEYSKAQMEKLRSINNYFAPVFQDSKDPTKTQSPSSEEVIPYVPM